MADIDIDRLIWIVVGVQLKAELGDRPLAYRVEQGLRKVLGELQEGGEGSLVPAVISDVYYLNNEEIQHRPVISVGGPGSNALSGILVQQLPTAAAIENSLVVQMDLDFDDLRCAVWGMDHLLTVQAVELFLAKYLEPFARAVVEQSEAEE